MTRTATSPPARTQGCAGRRREIAVLDVRETGVFTHRHILLAASAPLWRLEVLIDRLVPRRSTRIVLVDGDESLAHQAAAKLVRLGWRQRVGAGRRHPAGPTRVMKSSAAPTCRARPSARSSKCEKHTPWIDTDELQQRIARGDNIVVVDSRTPEEFTDFSLPFAHSLPGAELVYRIGESRPTPRRWWWSTAPAARAASWARRR
jgi:hypothetical protein